jgi:hypothetical protein
MKCSVKLVKEATAIGKHLPEQVRHLWNSEWLRPGNAVLIQFPIDREVVILSRDARRAYARAEKLKSEQVVAMGTSFTLEAKEFLVGKGCRLCLVVTPVGPMRLMQRYIKDSAVLDAGTYDQITWAAA